MPSYVIHLSCAKLAQQYLPLMNEREQNLFYLGNIAADMCKDKHYTHFWNDETYSRLVRSPDLNWFMHQYGDAIREPYVLGYYAHLLLDHCFLEEYWAEHFRFYNDAMQEEVLYDAVTVVEVTEQNQKYARKDFFSGKWYYGDYDRMNGYFAKKYMVSFPDWNLDEREWKQVRKIKEIDWAYAQTALMQTKKKLEQSICETCGTDTPKLDVFELPELEKLIERTAKKVAEI